MTTRFVNDAAGIQRLGMLIEAMDLKAVMFNADAEAHRAAGCVQDAYDSQMVANHAAWVAYRTRRLIAQRAEDGEGNSNG